MKHCKAFSYYGIEVSEGGGDATVRKKGSILGSFLIFRITKKIGDDCYG